MRAGDGYAVFVNQSPKRLMLSSFVPQSTSVVGSLLALLT
jgi:hypothetical protein